MYVIPFQMQLLRLTNATSQCYRTGDYNVKLQVSQLKFLSLDLESQSFRLV